MKKILGCDLKIAEVANIFLDIGNCFRDIDSFNMF